MTGAMSVKKSAECPTDQGKGEGTTPLPKIDLRDAHAIRREMATVYRDARAKRIGTQDGTRLAYMLNMLRQAVETSDLEARLAALEQRREKE